MAKYVENKNVDMEGSFVVVKNLKQYFPVKKWIFEKQKYVQAVDEVSIKLKKGETLGIVGESGCGKTTLARTILRLAEPTGGEIYYDGQDLRALHGRNLRKIRQHMQIVFQDPYSALNPRMKVERILREQMDITGVITDKKAQLDRIYELMDMVGLDRQYIDRYPHEFSGGQRQRIVIARALATNPSLLVCDEPVSALDVSVRAQILNLLEDLQDKLGLTYLFISHDLSVVEHICDRVAIMYLGQMVELGTVKQIYDSPAHPYTQALLSAIPQVDEESRRERILLEGDIPSPVNPPQGCHFRTRCRYATEACCQKPATIDIGDGHMVACHLVSAELDKQ